MTVISAREWGKQQAAKAPDWSEEHWERISQILGVRLVDTQQDEGRKKGEDESA